MWKNLERLLYNAFFITSRLISASQPGFKPGDPCINHFLSITHGIYASFDEGFEVRDVLLDILKAFDKVWHERLVYKLTQNGISSKFLRLIKQKQLLDLNGQCFFWMDVKAGVPQGSILSFLLFLI